MDSERARFLSEFKARVDLVLNKYIFFLPQVFMDILQSIMSRLMLCMCLEVTVSMWRL